jgi:hypothetical protein
MDDCHWVFRVDGSRYNSHLGRVEHLICRGGLSLFLDEFQHMFWRFCTRYLAADPEIPHSGWYSLQAAYSFLELPFRCPDAVEGSAHTQERVCTLTLFSW